MAHQQNQQQSRSHLSLNTLVAGFLILLSFLISPFLLLSGFSSGLTTHRIIHPAKPKSQSEIAHASPEISRDIQQWRTLLAALPRIEYRSELLVPNYAEDRALREALLTPLAEWQPDPDDPQHHFYRASNKLLISFRSPGDTTTDKLHALSPDTSNERALLTARVLLGLWWNRFNDERYSSNGYVVVRTDELLHWRGVQKHQRKAFPGASKRYSDGFQWKHKQQLVQDITLLSQCYVQGSHLTITEGKAVHHTVNSPYLSLMPIKEAEKAIPQGYAIAPGSWLVDYLQQNNCYFASLDRQVFQLNPQSERITLRLALYLTEQWRQQKRNKTTTPFVLADLLAASKVPIDRPNITTRFAPRVEAALQKLYTMGLLQEPPRCLTDIDKSKTRWGNEWLASQWLLLPEKHLSGNHLRGP
ncbi:hypothetical protein EI42_03670 [Thermosporothrix hazakensis]|uniref:Uncharacterized protein n=1 Tax=Thermosporothrix hazakensis TaxID=644383 RepID=A0A326U5K2_THEHA|nr:hypothetical protein [Thermosporothrix hazakensis]PZW27107.1 hypothetical protein EI42_03670 [Thermosporothrix hazakensis]GCE50390.1 hypothetical protein KTH_52590 [Thermosporothrix hazakensis]